MHFEANNHEEADTLLIHHAVLDSHRNPSDAQLTFFSPDADVLVHSVDVSTEIMIPSNVEVKIVEKRILKCYFFTPK